jgi:hypothetical protein
VLGRVMPTMFYALEHAPISRSDQPHGSTRGECLAPWAKSPQEGDAFLVGVRMWEIALLMGGGLQSRCSFGMHRPYIQVVLRRCAFDQGHPACRGEAFLEHPVA